MGYRKMTVGQAGVNPGAGLFSIAVNQGFIKSTGSMSKSSRPILPPRCRRCSPGKCRWPPERAPPLSLRRPWKARRRLYWSASWVNVFPYKIMAQKGIQKIEDLKGKTGHVGAPFGTIPDTALRFALNRLKIDPEKDVKLVQHSSADPASILAAMEKGEVQFGILAPPFDLIAEKRGYEMLLALPGLGIPVAAKRRVGAGFVFEKQPRQRSPPVASDGGSVKILISIRKKKPSRS